MRYIFILFISTLLSETIFDRWIDQNIELLDSFSIKIKAELFIKNEYSNQRSNIEINIKDERNFWLQFENRQIYYSENWTKIYDEKSNQLIIEVSDTNLLNNISMFLKQKEKNFTSQCITDHEIKCNVQNPDYGLFFDVFFNSLDSSLTKISHNYQMTTSEIKDIKVNKIETDNDDFWNPNFENSFIIDLRP
ncbi:MAG: hypothetical protein H8E60_02665 [Candidatus Marinimicrobia bacterium]|nr:hypothetical protein [Candidatus Neomarinimicrobiota bacterium]